MTERRAYINALAGAVPDHDVHRFFVQWAEAQIDDRRGRAVFRRMANRSGIEHRWSVLAPNQDGSSPTDSGGFYSGAWPPTSKRMEKFAEEAPELALQAIQTLGQKFPLDGVSHLVVASCTGFTAPGIDQIIAERLGLHQVERTSVGFMGCYAAVAALRLAHHIVRSEPGARVLVVTVELSTLHLQDAHEVEPLLAMLQFSDGAAAALVSSNARGYEISRLFSSTLPDSQELITWAVGDHGFAMHLSAEVPGRIAAVLKEKNVRDLVLQGRSLEEVDHWAVHAGGRSILDAVEKGLELHQGALAPSRDVLAHYGNMSSSTLMFIIAKHMSRPEGRNGVAVAFGPGLAAEGFHLERAA